MARNQLEGFPFHTSMMDVSKSKVFIDSVQYDLVDALAAASDGSLTGDIEPDDLAQTQVAFWADLDGASPRIWRMRDRVFIGNAAEMHGNRTGTNSTVFANTTVGASWAPRDSQMVVIHDRGLMAVTGMSRTSDSGALSSPACIGVSGFIINDDTNKSAWAMYADVQHESGAFSSKALEIAVKNKGADNIPKPYALGNGAYGIWAQAGGDNTYGGSSVNPPSAMIAAVAGASTWNVGIIFASDSLTGADGTTGTATAMSMGKGHIVGWFQGSGFRTGGIRSDGTLGGHLIDIVFNTDVLQIIGNNGKRIFQTEYVTNAVNYLNAKSSISGDAAELLAQGDDTNIDMTLTPKGSGVLRFGTRSAIGAETVTGYITIKDSGGTTRKLAVVS